MAGIEKKIAIFAVFCAVFMHLFAERGYAVDSGGSPAPVIKSPALMGGGTGGNSGSGTVLPALFTGTMSFSVPIEVPAGRKGMDPGLALTYSSANGNGWIGVGWNLELGAIERSTKNGVNYSGDDYIFRMSGSAIDLVNVGGNEYRAKFEGAFLKITKIPKADGSPVCWVVADKSGTQYRYGETADDRQDDPADANRVYSWRLNHVEDTNGNYMTISYTKDCAQIYPDRIDYTGNTAAQLGTTNSVIFESEYRTDLADMYTTNFTVYTRKRLKNIVISAQGNLVRKYVLEYDADLSTASFDYSGTTGRSVLGRVRQYGKDGVTELPAKTFGYQMGGTASSGDESFTVSGFNSGYSTSNTSYQQGDFNGDGKMDIINVNLGFDCTGSAYTWLSDGNGSFSVTSLSNFFSIPSSEDSMFQQTLAAWCSQFLSVAGPNGIYRLGDFNGDGKTDVVFFNRTFNYYGGNESWYATVWLSNGDGNFTPQGAFTSPIAYSIDNMNFQAGDFNGDGKTDLIFLQANTASGVKEVVWLSNGDGTFALKENTPERTYYNNATASRFRLGDFNGDGKTDLLYFESTYADVWLSKGDGTFEFLQFVPTGGYDVSANDYKYLTGDFNGDGKTDVVHFVCDSYVKVWLSNGTGSFTIMSAFTPWSGYGINSNDYKYQAGDFNGDGKTDLVHFVSGSYVNFWLANGDGTFSLKPATYTPWSGYDISNNNYSYLAGDFNGDGKTDLTHILSISSANVWTSNVNVRTGALPDSLTEIKNGLGGTITIGYLPSTDYTNTLLPFPVQTVSSVTTNDGNGVQASTSYTYSGGYYHIGQRDFRGFNYAQVTGPAGPQGEQAVSETWFHQGDDTAVDANNPDVTEGYMKGKPYRSRVKGANGAIFVETETTYLDDGAAPFFNPPLHVVSYNCDGKLSGSCAGNANAKTVSAVYHYNTTYGNVIREDQYGDPNETDDDRTIVRAYSPNDADWIVGLPVKESVYQGTYPQVAIADLDETKVVSRTTFYYDGPADCISSSTSQYPTKGNLTRIVRRLDGVNDPETRMAYDNYGNLKCAMDAKGYETTFDYDATNTFLSAVTNPKGQTTSTQYYSGSSPEKGLYGQVKSVTDPNLAVTTKEYDVFGRIVKVMDPYETTTQYGTATYAYLNFGTVGQQKVVVYSSENSDSVPSVCISGYTYNSSTGKCEAAPSCPSGLTLNPSANMCQLSQTAPCSFNGAAWSCPLSGGSACNSAHVCSKLSQVLPFCSPGGIFDPATDICVSPASTWTETYFDGFGRTIKTRSEGPNNKVIAAKMVYNARGAVYQTSLPYFDGQETERWTTYQYDALGRPLVIANPDTTTVKACYNMRLTDSLDPDGRRKRETRDALGRLVKVEEYSGKYTDCNATGTLYAATTYQYDALGNLRFVIDAKSNTTEMHYNALGRKDYMTDPDMGHWSYTYDANGNLETQTDAKGNLIQFFYDNLNRLTKKDYITDTTATDVTYGYDEVWSTSTYAVGRKTSMTDASGTTKYYYDKLGRATQIVKNVDGTDYVTKTTYDGKGRTTSIEYPDTEVVSYGYEAGGNLALVTGQSVNYAKYMSYNALGQPGTLTSGNNIVTTYLYKADNNRLQRMITGTHIDLSYVYDYSGNITIITNGLDSSKTQTFTYDDLSRLTQAVSTSYGTLSYIYDQIGNITQKEGITFDQYGLNAGAHAVTHTSDGKSYTYDGNGNMLTDGTRTIAYDYDNMPKSIQMGGDTTTFVYDGNGNRVKKMSPSETKVYIGKLYECNSGACSKYIVANGTRIAHKSGTIVYYYHTDHLGSTAVVTNEAGASQGAIYYKPFGATLSGSVPTDHQYTQQEFDDETGLYNYNARLYNPTLGRFISADTIVPSPFNPQSLNRYSYVMNNPLRYTDPSGNFSVSGSWFIPVSQYGGPGAAGSYDFSRGRGSIGVGWGEGGGFGVQSGSASIGYTKPGSWNVQYGYDSMAHSEYASGSWFGGPGVGVSGTYYFRNYGYQVSAGAGYKNYSVNVGYSRYGGYSAGVGYSLGGGYGQVGTTYNFQSKSWSYSYSPSVEMVTTTADWVSSNLMQSNNVMLAEVFFLLEDPPIWPRILRVTEDPEWAESGSMKPADFPKNSPNPHWYDKFKIPEEWRYDHPPEPSHEEHHNNHCEYPCT